MINLKTANAMSLLAYLKKQQKIHINLPIGATLTYQIIWLGHAFTIIYYKTLFNIKKMNLIKKLPLLIIMILFFPPLLYFLLLLLLLL